MLSAIIINIPADYSTIQAGINVAVDTDTVLVQPSTYIENINFNGKKITVTSLFLTTQDTIYISSTIIDGNQNGSVVTFESGEDSTAILCGFTITNGCGDPYGGGGGIYCSNSSPSITNVSLTGNSAYRGGGIYCNESSPNLSNVTISDNFGQTGGGINCEGSNLSLINSTIIENVTNYGGGIYCENSNLTLASVTIAGNNVGSCGGGICSYQSSLILSNVTIAENTATGAYSRGGGIYFGQSNLSIINSIVSGNTGKYGICAFSDNFNISISYSCFWNNEEGNFYNCGDSLGVNVTTNTNGDPCDVYYNIQLDPLFVNPENYNFHLTTNSPCIDTGNPNSPFDPDGTIADMGAFYYDQGVSVQNENIQSSLLFPQLSNYPNPLNPTTTIEFSIQNNSIVKLTICNIKGQKIKTLAHNEFTKGSHSIIWNGDDELGESVSSGVYLYKLNVNGRTEAVKKCLLLK